MSGRGPAIRALLAKGDSVIRLRLHDSDVWLDIPIDEAVAVACRIADLHEGVHSAPQPA